MKENGTPTYEYLAEDPHFKVMPIMISLIIGAFFAILNETLLNIALTTLMEDFHISLPTVQWMATGFMLVMGIIIPSSALLLQWFTTRQLYFRNNDDLYRWNNDLCIRYQTFLHY